MLKKNCIRPQSSFNIRNLKCLFDLYIPLNVILSRMSWFVFNAALKASRLGLFFKNTGRLFIIWKLAERKNSARNCIWDVVHEV